MAKISIDEGELLMAFESGDGMTKWFLDRETGQVIFLSDDDLEDEEEIRRAIYEEDDDEENERYLVIPSLGSNEGYGLMEDFAAAQEDRRVRLALFDALNRRRPFRSFKDALMGFPGVREAWFKYQEGQLREEALAWLRSKGIDAELVSQRDASPG